MIIQCPKCQSRYNTSHKKLGDAIHCHCGVDIQIPDLADRARSWHCPNCSGSVDPSKSRCDYCDAYIAFARCPACFSIAPYDEAKFCAECGETLILPIKPLQKKDKKSNCPRCKNQLKSKVVDAHLVDFCADCGGVWLAHHLFDDLLKNVPLNAEGALGKQPSKQKNTLPRHKVTYLRCPECDDTMSRHNFMNDSDIILDQCNTHGIWFDKHELGVALEYVRSSIKKPLSKHASKNPPKEVITRRDDNEVFEIRDEDLSLLLEEFPYWISK